MTTKWNKFDILWLVFSILIIVFASVYKFLFIINDSSNITLEVISCLVAVTGVTYVLGIAKQTRNAYFFGIGNVILYAIVCYTKGIYISMLYNLLYSFPIMIYGYINWGRVKNDKDSGIKSFNNKQRVMLGVFMIFIIGVFATISKNILSGNNVLLDAIVSVCVCVATLLMAKKYIEQWFLFIIANFFGVIMFIVINLNNMNDVELLIMWIIYLINSVYGMVEWKKTLNRE